MQGLAERAEECGVIVRLSAGEPKLREEGARSEPGEVQAIAAEVRLICVSHRRRESADREVLRIPPFG
jgi:hypothetical protein